MIGELHFYGGIIVFAACFLSASVSHTLSGLPYPGAPAPLLPEGPLRTVLVGDLAYLGVCGVLWLAGV